MLETSSKSSERKPTREVHLRDYFIVMARRKWLIIAAVLVTLSSTILYLRKQEPVYQAQANIIIEPRRPQEMIFLQSVQAISLDLQTQIEVIKMTPVLASVIEQLNLTTAQDGTPEFSDAVKALRRNIGIGFVKDTKVITITAKHTIPEKAQAIADAVAQAYIDQDRLSRLQSGRDAVSWLSVQLAGLKIKLRNSEEAFQKFKEKEGIITLDAKQSQELEEISRLNVSYITARASWTEIEAIISKIENQESEIENRNIPIALLNSPALQKLGDELSQLQTELADKRRLFKGAYPGVVELKNRMQLTEQKILAELKRQRDFLQAQEDSFLQQRESKHPDARCCCSSWCPCPLGWPACCWS